jgi:hypothetical protein
MRTVRSFVRSVRAAATKDIQTAFTGLIAAEAAAERERTCIQTALFIAPLLNHIRVAHLLSVWCIHGGESS